MGGDWRLRLPEGGPDLRTAARKAVQGALDLVDAQMSAWRPNSALCRVNAAPLRHWVDLPDEMAFVVGTGLALMRKMPEAFSILMGGASARYGFVPGRECAIAAAADAVDFDGHRIRRLADVALDLNSIAKGFAADLAAQALAALGHGDFLIEVAGDLVARGVRPGGRPWTVALELPIPDRIVPVRLFPLADMAVATSGGYRRARGRRSHLISPADGRPLPASGASVAVLAPTAMEADGWATALAVLGPEAGLAVAESLGLGAAFIQPDPPEGFIERGSSAITALQTSRAAMVGAIR
jgi:thiamine biosynthesis lipoprotein